MGSFPGSRYWSSTSKSYVAYQWPYSCQCESHESFFFKIEHFLMQYQLVFAGLTLQTHLRWHVPL